MKDKSIGVKLKDDKVNLKDRIKLFLKTFALSIYPDAYNRFSQKRYSQGLLYFLYVLLISMTIFSVMFLVSLPGFLSTFDSEFSKFEDLSLNMSMKLSEDIVLFDGKIKVSEHGNYTDESLMITQDYIYTKKTHCNLVPPLCLFGEKHKTRSTAEFYDLENESGAIKTSFIAFLSLAFPFLLILYLIVVGVKVLGLVLLLAILLLILTKFLKFKIQFQQVFLIVLYSSTFYLIAYPINTLVYGLYSVHLIVPVLLSLLGVFLVGEKKHRF